jgi:hypothetical protein
MFCRSLFVLFLLAIVLSVLLRYTDSDYPVGIFKLFLGQYNLTLRICCALRLLNEQCNINLIFFRYMYFKSLFI